MALQGSGQLLVEVRNHSFLALFGAAPPFRLPGYVIEPLSDEAESPTFEAGDTGDHWLVARPAAGGTDQAPWDYAHAAARANSYRHYVEPDILHQRPLSPPGQVIGGFDANWPPCPPNGCVSPAWHLGPAYTDFEGARRRATGKGVWIAHLDTGYRKAMACNPRGLRPELGHDYWSNKPNPVDPMTDMPWDMPGHGTATAALLAGREVNLDFGAKPYHGDLGGAPDANVIPVRIGPSVIHLWTISMARGIDHARLHQCDVASISHGGVPSAAWATAVNRAYLAGVNLVAASGDSIYVDGIDLVTRYTVYPSAFNRVITVVGATFDKGPYITSTTGEVQGCWGPDSVMGKAVAAFTPNIVWMDAKHPPDGFRMNGRGVSVATPQVAAACALWLELYATKVPDRNWLRVEACRRALFMSADRTFPGYDPSTFGKGLLRAAEMLDAKLADRAIETAKAAGPSHADSADFALWRLLNGIGPPGSEAEERMYETETAQVVLSSRSRDLLAGVPRAQTLVDLNARMPLDEQARYRALLHGEAISNRLRRRLS